jgi:hypothetical protein
MNKNFLSLFFILISLFGCLSRDENRRNNISVNHTSNGPRYIRVGYESSWSVQHRHWIHYTLDSLNEIGGPVFLLTSDSYDVIIKSWRTTNCMKMSAFYTPGTNSVSIDETCLNNELSFRSMAFHEIGHFMGMVHICRYAGERANCSPVGFGDAIMNPTVVFENIDVTGRTFQIYSAWQPTELDRREFFRTNPVN